MKNPLTPAGWMAVAGLLLALGVLGYCAVTKPARDAAARAEAGQTLAEGRTGAAQDASAIRDRSDERDQSTDDLSRSNSDAIRNAPGADVRLDDGVDRAARRAVCLRQSARNDPQCRAVLGADSR